MAELKHYDIVGAGQNGFAFGTQQRLQREGEQRQNALASLSAQAYGAAPDQRQGIVQQVVGTDPEAGFALNKNLGYDDDRRTRTMVNMAKMLTTSPEEARPALYQRMSAQFGQMGMQGFPPDYTPETKDLILGTAQSLLQAYSGNVQDSTPADIRSLQILRDNPELAELDRNRRQYSGMIPKMVQTSEGIGWGTPGAGIQLAPMQGMAGQGASAPAPGLYNTPYGQAVIDDALTPEQWQLVQADMAAGGGSDHYQLPNRDVPPQQFNTSSPVVAQPYQAPVRDTIPSGYRTTPSGDLEPIPGGPADKPDAQSKPLPPSVLRLRRESREALSVADGMGQEIEGVLQQIRSGDINLGPANNLMYRGLNAAGTSTPASRAYQGMRSTFEKMRNDSLRLNNGVQTEGDAQRAWNELLGNLNDNQNVAQQLERIQRINQRAIQLHMENLDEIDAEYGSRTAPAQRQTRADYEALPRGALYIAPDGSQRRKP